MSLFFFFSPKEGGYVMAGICFSVLLLAKSSLIYADPAIIIN